MSTPVAMILAAGRGKRLRPLTDQCPKPLIALDGKPLIEYHLEKLAQAGIEQVVINCAWLCEQFEPALGDGSRWGLSIHYSYEPEGGLETAGGIIQALPHLGQTPFIVVNGDVFSELDYHELVDCAQQLSANKLGHLWLVPTPEFKAQGDFGLLEHCVQEQGEWTFAGMSVLRPELFAGQAVGFTPLAPILREAMAQQALLGSVYTGYWSDIGTIERLQTAQAYLDAKRYAD